MAKSVSETLIALCLFFIGPIAIFASKGVVIILILAALGSAFLAARGGEPLAWRPNRFGYLMAGFLGFASLSAFWSDYPADALSTVGPLALIVVAGFLISRQLRHLDEQASRRIAIYGGVGFAFALVLLGVELLTGSAIGLWIAENIRGVSALPAKPTQLLTNGIAVLVVLVWPLAAILFNKGYRLPALALVGMTILATFFAGSETNIVAAVAGVLLGLLAAIFPIFARRLTLAGVALASLALPLFLIPLPPPNDYADLIPRLSESAYHRLDIWENTAEKIAERPFLGHGFDSSRSFGRESGVRRLVIKRRGETVLQNLFEPIPLHPHSMAMQVWLELGVIGALIFCALVLGAVTVAARSARHWFERFSLFGMLGSTGLISLVAYGAWQNWWQSTIWLGIASMAMALHLRRTESRKTPEPVA